MAPNGPTCLTVLVVDDYEDSRFMMRRILEMRDCRVLEAADGLEAVEIARQSRPDLVLMDLNMPHMDGLMAARQLRECDGCREVPILVLTAYDTYGMEAAAKEAGCDAYLLKPVDFDELDRTVRRLLPGW